MIEALWSITDHLCRHCLGRVLMGDTGVFLCSRCGATGDGTPNTLCGCGISVGDSTLATKRLFKCVPNPRRSPACPSEIVISLGSVPASEFRHPDEASRAGAE
jgi:hypothetical protein